jgi:heterotetrameric sarcosine oxidase gamma subunit
MTEFELRITRVGLRSASLLQIHPDDSQKLATLADGSLGEFRAGHSATEGPRAYSLGPTEWLLIDFPFQDVRRRLSTDLGRALIRVTDISAAFASLKVEGTGARAVLASDIGAPWAAQSSQPGQYVRTRLGHVEVVLHCVGPDSFELLVDRSVADHLEAWLAARSAELAPAGASYPGPLRVQ